MKTEDTEAGLVLIAPSPFNGQIKPQSYEPLIPHYDDWYTDR